MNDHELCNYIKENYDVKKEESVVLVIDFNPQPQFKEYHFKIEHEETAFILGLPFEAVFAVVKYYNDEKVFAIEGRNYLGSENLVTGEIYEWRVRPKSPGKVTPEKLKVELQQLIKILKKQAS